MYLRTGVAGLVFSGGTLDVSLVAGALVVPLMGPYFICTALADQLEDVGKKAGGSGKKEGRLGRMPHEGPQALPLHHNSIGAYAS